MIETWNQKEWDMMYKPEQRVTSLKSRDILSPVGKWMLTKNPIACALGVPDNGFKSGLNCLEYLVQRITGITKQHASVVQEKQGILNTCVTCGHTALEHD